MCNQVLVWAIGRECDVHMSVEINAQKAHKKKSHNFIKCSVYDRK